MINLINELTIYEVIFASYDEDGNYEECMDDATIISPSYLSPQDVIEEAILQGEIDPENRLVQVYEARSATINVPACAACPATRAMSLDRSATP